MWLECRITMPRKMVFTISPADCREASGGPNRDHRHPQSRSALHARGGAVRGGVMPTPLNRMSCKTYWCPFT